MPLRISSRSCPDVIAIAYRYRESRQALDINRHSSPHSISCYPDSRAVQHPALPCQSPSAPNTSFSFPLRSQSTPPQFIIPPRLFSPSLLANDYVVAALNPSLVKWIFSVLPLSPPSFRFVLSPSAPEQRLRDSRSLQHSSLACHTQLFAPSSRHALPAPSSPCLPLSLFSRVLKHAALPCQSHSLPPSLFPATLTPSDRPPSSPCISLYSPDLRTATAHLQQAQVGWSYCISSSHTPRASRSTHPFLELLVGKGSEARQNAAVDLAALVGPLAAGKTLNFSATSSSSAATGTSGAGGTGAGGTGAGGTGAGGTGAGGTGAGVAAVGGVVTKFLVTEFDLALEVINSLHLRAMHIHASLHLVTDTLVAPLPYPPLRDDILASVAASLAEK
ncbi:unnamed protein product [Closterium sp. NIES-65]|nr:unnamed protein product [Closterium sp. NIES-65]